MFILKMFSIKTYLKITLVNQARKSVIENNKIRTNYKMRISTIFCRSKNCLNFKVVDLRVLQEVLGPMIMGALLI